MEAGSEKVTGTFSKEKVPVTFSDAVGGSIIVAVGSPPGRSRRGLIRVSGSGSIELLRTLVGEAPTPRRGIARVRLGVPAPGLAALAIVMPGPGSATGDDTFELLLPGNPLLLERLIDELIAIDPRVRRAGPGEFSARAFINGRLTLDEAEGVAALIQASSDAELHAARRLANGALSARCTEWSSRIVELCALVEAGIDFTDEDDVVAIEPTVLASRVRALSAEIDGEAGASSTTEARSGHAARAESWRPRVALVGAPNAGKSTLFNALAGAARTVASPIAGTTRDAIEVEIVLGAVEARRAPMRVMLVDLPGLDAAPEAPASSDAHDGPKGLGAPTVRSGSKVRDRSIDAALAPRLRTVALGALNDSDLILRCEPFGHPAALPEEVERAIADRPTLRVATKCDGDHRALTGLPTSAVTGLGLAELRAAIAQAIGSSTPALAGSSALVPRHRAALSAAREHLLSVQQCAEREPARGPWHAPEQTAAALRLALDAIGQITGATTPDDVLGVVFARFCIGK